MIVAGSGFAPQVQAYSIIPALPYFLYKKEEEDSYKPNR